jgi:hypothetical protein
MMEGGAPATHDAGDEEGAPATPEESPAALARRAQFLATEHWSLLATRSMSWNESFSRTAMFLATLSAATVALALAGPAMAFGSAFALFAIIVLSVTLFLGLTTFVRLIQVNHEDLYWVFGMNRLRGAYARMAPGIEHDFITGWTTDAKGLARTFGAVDVTTPSPLHALVTTPAVVAVISSAIAGVIGGVLAIQLGTQPAVAVATGVAVFVGTALALTRYGIREYGRYVERIGRQYGIELSTPAAVKDAARR